MVKAMVMEGVLKIDYYMFLNGFYQSKYMKYLYLVDKHSLCYSRHLKVQDILLYIYHQYILGDLQNLMDLNKDTVADKHTYVQY